MTLDQIVDSLPHGFHDALLLALAVDYAALTAQLEMEICVGDPDSSEAAERDRRRPATLTISGLTYFIVEAPDWANRYSFCSRPALDAGSRGPDQPQTPASSALPPVEGTGFEYWFFVYDWNSCIWVGATDAQLTWGDEGDGR